MPNALTFLGGKVFSSTTLRFKIANYHALLAKYHFTNYSKVVELNDKFPEEDRAQFQALLDECKLVAKTWFQTAVNISSTISRAIATAIVVMYESWLHSLVVKILF